MQYALLIYDDEQAWAALADADRGTMLEEYGTLTEDLRGRGAYVLGEALQPTRTATTVRVRDGETLVTDGPFAETKEQLGGLYLVEAGSLDEALEWAARIPAVRSGSIEVRPVMVFGDGA